MLDVLRSILRVTKSIVAVTRHFAFSKRHYFQWWPRVPVSALRRRQKKPLVHPSPPAHCIVSDLPPEILREIFLHCILLPGKWGSFSSRDTPLVLIKVCREWREVAVSTPELWSVLPFLRMYPRLGGDHLQLLFESYLKYSARAALSVRLDLPQHPNDDPSLLLITPYLSRSQHLSIVYFDDFSDLQPFIARTHLPILKTLELELTCRTGIPTEILSQLLDGRRGIGRLPSIKFPWAQLTQLTIPFHNITESLMLLGNCSSLEMFRLRISQRHIRSETSYIPLASDVVHRHLRTISFDGGSGITDCFVGLLDCLVTPALSTLEFIQPGPGDIHRTEHHTTMQPILSFIRTSSAELTSLIMNGIRCSLQDLMGLSALIPMVTELDLYGLGADSLQLLTIKSNSPHDILFPRLERLVVRYHLSTYAGPELSYCSYMFHSRLYLAPNRIIIEDVSPLQHAELHLASLVGRVSLVGCISLIGCGLLDPEELDRLDKGDLQRLIRSLRSVYLKAVDLDENKHSTKAKIHHINWSVFPAQHELGYWAKILPIEETTYFFRKLDAAFRALEGYHITHALEILVNKADRLMHEFSCLPDTAFLHHPAYKFHMRAAHLLKQWRPMMSEYEGKDRWICECDHTIDTYKVIYRRGVGT